MENKQPVPLVMSTCCLLVCAAVSSCWAQSTRELTARELFYKPLNAAKTTTQAPVRTPPAKTPKTEKIETTEVAKSTATRSEKAHKTADVEAQPVSNPEIIPVSNRETFPLGLRYSFLLFDGGQPHEVDADTTFHSGDRMRVRLRTNDDGYLYIVMRGTSGTWRVMFPSKEYDNGDNRVQAGKVYELPKNTRFVFSGDPGTERIFLVFSRVPVTDLDQMIYGLHSGPPTGRPVSGEEKVVPAAPPRRTMLASASLVNDELVNEIRGRVLARDLVFEKVDESSSASSTSAAEAKEKAVYVVNKREDAASQLVVDISLKHQ